MFKSLDPLFHEVQLVIEKKKESNTISVTVSLLWLLLFHLNGIPIALDLSVI